MKEIGIFFILLNNAIGYIPPQMVDRTTMTCGLQGEVIGIQLDGGTIVNSIRHNPTKALWTDPDFASLHCEVSIRNRVANLTLGEYHIATTIFADGTMSRYREHDPHTSVQWIRSGVMESEPVKPVNMTVSKGELK